MNTQNSYEPGSPMLAEKRERRRQRILQNAEDRISKILAAPNGGEKRQAPAIEGMCSEQTLGADALARGKEMPTTNVRKDVPDGGGTFQERLDHCRSCFDRHRLSVTVSFGVLFRLLVQFGLVRFIALTFLVMFITYQIFLLLRFSNGAKSFVSDSLTTNFLLVCGLNEHFARLSALVFELFCRFVTDFFSMTFAFLVTHCLFIVPNYLQPIAVYFYDFTTNAHNFSVFES